MYDPSLRPKDWFSDYARRFRTVEVNNTFYRLPEPATFRAWRAQAPAGFMYALKLNQYGTHRRRLREPGPGLGNFVERAVLLGPALGPNLVQLPPRWRRDPDRLAAFLEAATSFEAGTSLHIETHSGGTSSRPRPGGAGPATLRWAVEFRDPSWLHEDTLPAASAIQGGAVRARPVAGPPVAADGRLGLLPVPRTEGAGPEVLGRLRAPSGWQNRPKPSASGRTRVSMYFAYFNNDEGGAAVRDATWLRHRLGS